MTISERTARCYHTLRHLRLNQVVARVLAIAKERLPAASRTKGLLPVSCCILEPRVPFLGHEPWHSARDVDEGRFRFCQRERRLGRPVDWTADGMPLLWRFNLHYFNYLFLLDAVSQRKMCREWVAANPAGRSPGWHPFPTSLRVMNWCRAGLRDERLQASLYEQAAYLYRRIERHIGGNHLLENARALVMAGMYFGDYGEAPRWLVKGLSIYREQTPEQILPDGGHYERSPMYHALVLEGYLDVLNVLPYDHPDRQLLAETAGRMCDFLLSLSHPDGDVALFNDATVEIAPPPTSLLVYARDLTGHDAAKRFSFPETGYHVVRTDSVFMPIDAGPIGPDHLPAHAHADTFSYELSLNGERMIVDGGVYEYEAGEMRDYVRSTRAHNTVALDSVDQAECWASFRVARRFLPTNVSFEHNEREAQFGGSFSGYAQLIGDGIIHTRMVRARHAERTIRIRDEIKGRGTHTSESYIHFHPDAAVSGAGQERRAQRGAAELTINVLRGAVEEEAGWYCPRFGVRRENVVLKLCQRGSLPHMLEYEIRY